MSVTSHLGISHLGISHLGIFYLRNLTLLVT
jgi:hypothetical protein